MKKEIHPKYGKTIIKCACGNEFETQSTVPGEIHVELCSACHPFYTGKQKFVDTAGRVDKFKIRLEKAKSNNKSKIKNNNDNSKSKVDNSAVLGDIKKELTENKKSPDFTLTQEESSDVDAAAVSELVESTETIISNDNTDVLDKHNSKAESKNQ